MHALSTSRTVLCLWIALLAMTTLVVSSPVPEPIDPNLSAVISNNLNLGCQNGCPAAASVQQLDTSGTLGSTANPLSILGGLALAGSILATL